MNVAALLSGGVDSSVAVHLLCEQGIRPDLFYIKIGMTDDGYSCPQEEDLEIVQAMAHRYGLHYEVVDLQQEYWDNVVSYTIDKVRRGFTPNPDVMCNRLIKFGAFHQKAGHEYDFTATGHYAQIRVGSIAADGCFVPSNGEDQLILTPSLSATDGVRLLGTTPDPVKDQTDFLAQITDLQLSHSLFPIGHMAKGEVRRVAEEAKLPSAHRKDSQGICFLGKINYNEFIERFLGVQEGPIVELETGKILGRHRGYWFHTIGQRKGLYLSGGPWFVIKKDIDQNIIYVSRGYDPEAQKQDWLVMRDVHWISLNPFAVRDGQPAVSGPLADVSEHSLSVKFKIRHVAELNDGILTLRDDGSLYLKSTRLINGVAPGQFCCIYTPDGTICLGSGEISWE